MAFATQPIQNSTSNNSESGGCRMVTRCMLVVLCVHFVAATSQLIAADEPNGSDELRAVSGPVLNGPLLENARDGLAKVGAISRQLVKPMAKPASNSDRVTDGQPYVWVRMSKGYLAKHVERAVDREKPARDEILGI